MDNREAVMLPLLIENAGLIAICGCAGLILASAVGRWPFAAEAAPDAVTAEAPAGVQAEADGRVQGRTEGVRESSGHGQRPDDLDGTLPPVGQGLWRAPPKAVVTIGAASQARDFYAWMVEWEWLGAFTSEETLAFYAAWVREQRANLLPGTIILDMLLAETPVTRSRPRVKDPNTGRVAKTAGGTDIRVTVYTFAAAVIATPTGVSAAKAAAGVVKGLAAKRQARGPAAHAAAPLRRAAA